MINIIIGTVEGTESYTEVNFFKGIVDQEQSLNLLSFGLSKASKTKTKQRNKAKLMRVCEGVENIGQEISLFFIGDGEVKEDIKCMKETYSDAIEYIKELLPGHKIIFNELILPIGKKFEEVLNFKFPTKAGTYHDGFKHFLDDKGMWKKEKVDWDKLLEFFNKTEYKEIFRTIHSLIK